jgi:seryl-tRNA synthetase
MLDIKLLRENPEKFKINLEKRKNHEKYISLIDEVLKVDNLWKIKKKELDLLKSQRNKESENINKIKKEGGNFKSKILEVKEISNNIKKFELSEKEILDKRNDILNRIPNLLNENVPIGKNDEDNKFIKSVLEKPVFDFKPLTHQELCEKNDWYDLKTASKISGSRFYYLKNELVFLEMALQQFVLNKLKNKGFEILYTPPMIKMEAAKKVIPLGDFKETIYRIENEGEEMCLIATAEHTLSTLHFDKIFSEKELPKYYCGISQSFRKEAGVSKDEKGIFRVHNFNKIEMFIYSNKEDSEKEHKFITNILEEIFSDLKLHYNMVDICSGDIGIFANRKYDLEAWLPGQNKYREMGSSSNYLDFGARKTNTRYQNEKNEIEFCHTLNNTACAMTRTIIAILEQYQTKEGNVKVPEILKPYLGNNEFLK